MFFRRQRPHAPTWEERLPVLREAGFQVRAETGSRVWMRRGASAAVVENPGQTPPSPRGRCSLPPVPRIVLTGRWLGDQFARLVDGGFQKFWRAPDGREAPALAGHLSELHAFQEDLREALGLISYYHTSLGTTNDLHLYDRAAPLNASNSR
jgi:hypothetical protein